MTDPNGNQIEVEFDSSHHLQDFIERTNRTVRPAEGDYTTSYTYSAVGTLVQRTLPRTNRVQFIHDTTNPQVRSKGNLLEYRQQANGVGGGGTDLVTRWMFEPVWNQRRAFVDGRGFPAGTVPLDGNGHLDLANPTVARFLTLNLFDYQEGTGFQTTQGVPVSEQIPENLGDLNAATDFNQGSVVKVNFPTIQTAGPNNGQTASEIRTFNSTAQPLTIKDPEARVTAYEYFLTNGLPADATDREGYLKKRIRASGVLNLTEEWGYDVQGNVTAYTDPKLQTWNFIVNQLNQVVRRLSCHVNGVQLQTDYIWNANDDCTETRVDNRDEASDPYPYPTGFFKRRYNIRHRPFDRDDDKTRNDGSEAGFATTQYFYDANLNLKAVKLPEAVAGNQPSNILSQLWDERDLLYKVHTGDNDTDPTNAPPSTASTRTRNYDPNRALLEVIDSIRQAVSASAPTTSFPGSAPGDVTKYTLDGFDRVKAITDAEANVTDIAFDLASNEIERKLTGPVDHQPGAQVRVLIERDTLVDERNRTVSTTDQHRDFDNNPVGDGTAVTTYTYDKSSLVTVVTDDRSLTTTTQYDAAARRIKMIDHLLNEIEWGLDANGNVTTETRRDKSTDLATPQENFVTTNVYDCLDRRTKSTDPAGDVFEWFRDSRNNVVKTSDAVRGTFHPFGPGNIVKYHFDMLNRLWKTERQLTSNGRGDGTPSGVVITTQTWDLDSRLISQTDHNNRTTAYLFDELNRQTRITYADTTQHNISFNTDNQVEAWVDQNATACAQTYDGLARLLTRAVTRGPGVLGSVSEAFGYDGASRITKADNDDGVNPATWPVRRQYDSLSNMTFELQDEIFLPVQSVYDGVGNRTLLTYPSGFGEIGYRRNLALTYDNLNRLQTITEEGGAGATVANYHYKGPWRTERRTYGDDGSPITKLDLTWDTNPRMTVVNHTTGAGGQIAKFEYGHDRMDHRLYEKRVHDGNLGDVFTPDSIYRVTKDQQDVNLVGVSPGTEIDPATFSSTESIAYTFDGVQNRTQHVKTVSGVPTTTTYTMLAGDSEVNQYSQTQEGGNPAILYVYDNNGNLKSDGTRDFHYDFKNRLVKVTATVGGGTIMQYAHDAFDRRTEKTYSGGSLFYAYDGIACIEEHIVGLGLQKQYVWGPGVDELLQQIQQTEGGPITTYAHQNAIGSTIALTSDTGSLVNTYRYDPFGNLVAGGGGEFETEYRFHGARFDPETGLYWMRARHYHPGLGRFLQRDPIGVWTDEPNTGNGLVFVANDATDFRDPSGQIPGVPWTSPGCRPPPVPQAPPPAPSHPPLYHDNMEGTKAARPINPDDPAGPDDVPHVTIGQDVYEYIATYDYHLYWDVVYGRYVYVKQLYQRIGARLSGSGQDPPIPFGKVYLTCGWDTATITTDPVWGTPRWSSFTWSEMTDDANDPADDWHGSTFHPPQYQPVP